MWPMPAMPEVLVVVVVAAALVAVVLALQAYQPRTNEQLRAEPRVPPTPTVTGDPETLVVVALSGGGSRAAAFAWRTLLALRDVRYRYEAGGTTRETSLADEIGLISAISGGSFAAAAWSLFRDRPETFRRSFLERNIEHRLALGLLWPPRRWLSLAAPLYSRINVAAEIYDQEVFGRRTLGELPPTPELRLHATNLAMGTRFTFTPTDFGYLGSDFSSYPVGYACAACSAFPVLLSPLTLRNYSDSLPRSELDKDIKYRLAKLNARHEIERDIYRRLRESYVTPGNRYVHLADGGLVDNQGLQAILDEWEVGGLIHRALFQSERPLRRLVIVNVNAGTTPDDDSSRRAKAPGLGSVVKYTMVTSMDILSSKRWTQIKDLIANFYDRDDPEQVLEEPYTIEVSFRNIADNELRRRCHRIPTSFHLEPDELDTIDAVAPQLLMEDPEMKRLLAALGSDAAR